ncbi:MAG: dihydrofolate reductase [Candidatus Pacebacteria bacterium]|nr:dihydrofolate reductase [Candidatus Paceibacterota bacterium]MDD5356925.1 dihydrofolate reductase [Candidatus Paceibacterota bacterium]
MSKVNMIAGISEKTRGLGTENKLLWRIPEDLKRFKALTMGHPIIMGRKTYESIGRALPGRANIIVTRNKDFKAEGCIVTNTIEEALEKGRASEGGAAEIFVIGGGEIYKQALPFADRLYLTIIHSEIPADTFFPEYENEFKKETFREEKMFGDLKYSWVTLEK